MDHIEKEFDYCGYHCVITFTELGYLCGYIQLNEDDALYDKRFTEINDNHILSMPLSYTGWVFPKNDDHFWIGFTCDNRGDKPDLKKVVEIYGEKPLVLTLLNMNNIPIIPKDGTIRTVEYVQDKLERLVTEIKDENRRQNTRFKSEDEESF